MTARPGVHPGALLEHAAASAALDAELVVLAGELEAEDAGLAAVLHRLAGDEGATAAWVGALGRALVAAGPDGVRDATALRLADAVVATSPEDADRAVVAFLRTRPAPAVVHVLAAVLGGRASSLAGRAAVPPPP